MIREYEEKQKSILEKYTQNVKLLLEYVIARYLTDQNDLLLITALVNRFKIVRNAFSLNRRKAISICAFLRR